MTMPRKWAILDLQYIPTPTGLIVKLLTDEACHLWMRFTTEIPRKHPLAILRRGRKFPDDIRFCFVAYDTIEQCESADTKTHHFYVWNWPPCLALFFYFFGLTLSRKSPSESPIFGYHRPEPLWTYIITEYWTS